jgi:hypothetical protein
MATATPLARHAPPCEALIHSLRGRDEEGLSTLHAADEIAEAAGDRRSMAEARAELGYVDFLRAAMTERYWLIEARDLADGAEWIVAKAIYLGLSKAIGPSIRRRR